MHVTDKLPDPLIPFRILSPFLFLSEVRRTFCRNLPEQRVRSGIISVFLLFRLFRKEEGKYCLLFRTLPDRLAGRNVFCGHYRMSFRGPLPFVYGCCQDFHTSAGEIVMAYS